ncbi:MAG TPA: SRPBCC family protein [Sphingobacteriaceae bacterium]
MTVFESKAIIARSASEVYSFLSDLNNHEKLMPENVYNWSSTSDEARFTIQNMAKLALKVSNRIENSTIIIAPAEEVPFGVELRWVISDNGDNSTTAVLTISADLNMMMKMLASGPLQKLTDHQTQKLKSVLA